MDNEFHEGGPRPENLLRRGTVAAVIRNPFAGAYVEDIAPFMEDLKPLGLQLARDLLSAMAVETSDVQSYG